MEDKVKLLKAELGDHRIKTEVEIGDYLDSKRRCKSSALYIATTLNELQRVLSLCLELRIEYLVIGSGSKIDLKDSFRGLIVKNRADSIRISGIKGQVSRQGLGVKEVTVEAESGVSLTGLANYVRVQGLTGLEDLREAPGTIGGSLTINRSLRERTFQVKVFTPKMEVVEKELADVQTRDIILSLVFKLKSQR